MRLIGLLILFLISHSTWAATPFRFHIFSEPSTLDPQVTASASGNYLFHALYRGLFAYHSEKGLVPEGAKTCTRAPGRLTCRLDPEARWSTGTRVTAADYVASFRRLIDPGKASPQSDVLFSLKNARDIWAGKKGVEQLGVRAVNEDTLVFEFAEADPEFEFKLIHPALTPHPPGGYHPRETALKQITNGPYVISEWKSGTRLLLDPNPASPGASQRPDVEALIIESDETALRLYESGKLDFLRRLTANQIPRFKGKPEFRQVPMARFDYIGFGPKLVEHGELRAALVSGIEFDGFLRLFDTKTRPGCPSLPMRFLDKEVCQTFDSVKAGALVARASRPEKLEFHFSRMGGDDIARAAEWFQGQWRKHTGVSVQLNGQEQGVYLRNLKANPPHIFRKGVSLDRPTCLAALELFGKGHPENYIRLDDAKFERALSALKATKDERERRQLCRQGIEILLGTNRLIPLGEMYFTILAKPSFTGWDLNELNQLDLRELRRVNAEL